MNQQKYVPPDEVFDSVINLLADAQVLQPNGDECFLECLMCGEWDGHVETCPVPILQEWLEQL